MKITINEKAKTVTIVLPLVNTPSKSGKSTLLATTSGNAETGVDFGGQEVIAGVNIYVPAA